jgi:hypothetical protein
MLATQKIKADMNNINTHGGGRGVYRVLVGRIVGKKTTGKT